MEINENEYVKDILQTFNDEDIINYLKNNGYKVIDTYFEEETDLLSDIKNVCRQLQPSGYIGKEEAKKILCEYLDNWMIKCF